LFRPRAKTRWRPPDLYRVTQPLAVTRNLSAGETYHFGYQQKGPEANHFPLAGRIIRHLIGYVHEAAPQQSPVIEVSFDGQSWAEFIEGEREELIDLFCSEFWVRVTSEDDARISVVIVYAQEFGTES